MLTVKKIMSEWKYITETPAHGKHYFNDTLDMCAVVYASRTRVYSNRKLKGSTAHCFKDCEYIDEGYYR